MAADLPAAGRDRDRPRIWLRASGIPRRSGRSELEARDREVWVDRGDGAAAVGFEVDVAPVVGGGSVDFPLRHARVWEVRLRDRFAGRPLEAREPDRLRIGRLPIDVGRGDRAVAERHHLHGRLPGERPVGRNHVAVDVDMLLGLLDVDHQAVDPVRLDRRHAHRPPRTRRNRIEGTLHGLPVREEGIDRAATRLDVGRSQSRVAAALGRTAARRKRRTGGERCDQECRAERGGGFNLIVSLPRNECGADASLSLPKVRRGRVPRASRFRAGKGLHQGAVRSRCQERIPGLRAHTTTGRGPVAQR